MAYIVLKDVPGDKAIIDLVQYNLQNGFMGFMNVSKGVHYVSIKTLQGYYTGFWCFNKRDDIIIKIFNKSLNIISDAESFDVSHYSKMVMSKAIDNVLIEYDLDCTHQFGELSYCLRQYGKIPELKLENTLSSISNTKMSPFAYTFKKIYNKNIDLFLAEFQYAFLLYIIRNNGKDDLNALKRWVDIINIVYTANQKEMHELDELICTWSSVFLKQVMHMHERLFEFDPDVSLYEKIFGDNIIPFINNMITHEDVDIKKEGKRLGGILEEYDIIAK